MTKRIILAVALIAGVFGVGLASAGIIAQPAAACGDKNPS